MLSSCLFSKSSFFVQNFSLLLFFLQIELLCHSILCFWFFFCFKASRIERFLGLVLIFLVVVSSQIIKGFSSPQVLILCHNLLLNLSFWDAHY